MTNNDRYPDKAEHRTQWEAFCASRFQCLTCPCDMLTQYDSCEHAWGLLEYKPKV